MYVQVHHLQVYVLDFSETNENQSKRNHIQIHCRVLQFT